jgi:hypothetical protein
MQNLQNEVVQNMQPLVEKIYFLLVTERIVFLEEMLYLGFQKQKEKESLQVNNLLYEPLPSFEKEEAQVVRTGMSLS